MTTSAVHPPEERLEPARPTWPDATGHFGVFGGRFVPEALIAALDELTEAYEAMRVDPAYDSLKRTLLPPTARRLAAGPCRRRTPSSSPLAGSGRASGRGLISGWFGAWPGGNPP